MEKQGIVRRLRNYILGLTEIGGHPVTDFNHAVHVAEIIVPLAELRDLDVITAELIAWLHDIGRIKGLEGNHALVGAKEADRILRGFGLDEEEIEIIVRAISYHSQKNKVHDPYSELIKDADALAHEQDHLALDEYETFRVHHAFELAMHVEPLEVDIVRIYESLLEKCNDYLKTAPSGKMVHDFRICLRKMRTILWLIHESQANTPNEPKKAIKRLFSILEKARDLHVFKKFLKQHEIDYTAVARDIEEAYVILKEALAVEKPLIIPEYFSSLETDKLDYKKVFDTYLILLRKEEPGQKDLHKLRKEGKKIKYLYEMGLVKYNDFDYDLLCDLHKQLGMINDLYNFKVLSQTYQIDGLLIDELIDDYLKNLRPLLFKMLKRLM